VVPASVPASSSAASADSTMCALRWPSNAGSGSDVYDSSAAQWFIVTDLGLATMDGSDGLHVFVRSLSTTAAKVGVTVQVLAVNNTVLGEAVTDSEGYAVIAPGLLRGSGGATPAMLTVAEGDGDFAFMSLKDAAFDLSDRGVAGLPSPPPIDVFLTTDRGAYRVGKQFLPRRLRATRGPRPSPICR